MHIRYLWLNHKEHIGCDTCTDNIYHSTFGSWLQILFTKYLKFCKWTLFCVTSLHSTSVRMHIWAEIPSGKHIHPNPAQISWWKPGAAPATEGIPLMNVFCSSEEMRVRQRRREVLGGSWNWITMVTSITFFFHLPPPSRTHITRGNEFQKWRWRFNRHLYFDACQATETSLTW